MCLYHLLIQPVLHPPAFFSCAADTGADTSTTHFSGFHSFALLDTVVYSFESSKLASLSYVVVYVAPRIFGCWNNNFTYGIVC